MKKIRQILSRTIFFTLCLLYFNINFIKAAETNHFTTTCKVNENLSEDGSLMLSNLKDITIIFDNISYNQSLSSLNLNGIVKDTNIPFDINAKLYNSKSYDKALIGDAIDTTNNFDIIFLGLFESIPIEQLNLQKSLADQKVFNIYLMKKDTREFIMIELPISLLENTFPSLSDVNFTPDNQLSNSTLEQWWSKIYTPIIEEEPSLLTATENAKDITLTYRQGPANCYKYKIKLHYWNTINGNIMSFAFQVADQQYFYNGIDMHDNTNLEVFDCVGIVGLSNSSGKNNDAIQTLNWGQSTVQSSGGLSVDTYLSISYGLFGASISWSPVDINTSIDNFHSFETSRKVKCVKIPFDKPLSYITNQYSIGLTLDSAGTTNKKKVTAKYSFKIGFRGYHNKLVSKTVSISSTYK